MALAARTLQRVRFTKCVFLSDAGLCAMAEFLWLEQLDVSGCHRLTDDGLEVLSEVRPRPQLEVYVWRGERHCRIIT